jgi:hypothetical protein
MERRADDTAVAGWAAVRAAVERCGERERRARVVERD